MIRSLLAGWLLTGCAYHCTIESTPAGAQITLPDGTTATTPAEVQLEWGLFVRRPITASAVGYRTVSLDLRKARKVELVLVQEHGGAGTWTEDEVP